MGIAPRQSTHVAVLSYSVPLSMRVVLVLFFYDLSKNMISTLVGRSLARSVASLVHETNRGLADSETETTH